MEGSLTDEQVHVWLQEIADKSFISLHSASPALSGTSYGEIAGGGYHRYRMSWHDPKNRGIWSLEDAVFSGLKATRVTYFGIWNQLRNGRLMGYAELPSPTTIPVGTGFVLHSGDIAISLG